MASLREKSWIHGVNVQLEGPSLKALRQGFGSTVMPDQTLSGWVHIAIPTPAWLFGIHLKAQTAIVQVATGGAARISQIHVYDGETKILDINPNITGPTQMPSFPIPNTPDVDTGTVICMGVYFDNTGPDAWCRVIGGGIDFA
jgi:hypothetical protein